LRNAIHDTMPEVRMDKGAAFDALHHVVQGKLQDFQLGLGNRKAPGGQLTR